MYVMSDNEILRKAKKRVKARKGFYGHLSAYVSVGLFFLLMNIATWGDSHEWWFFFPMLPWGVGLLIHYLSVFGFPGSGALSDAWEEREMEKAIRHVRRQEGLPPEPEVSEDLDFPREGGLELPDLDKRKEAQTRWDERDIV